MSYPRAMDEAFWSARWREGRIGFHEGRVNPWLARFADRLAGRVLVPLCGKAEDLAWLAARGHEVIGVELVEQAVRAFFDEHRLVPAVTRRGPALAYQADAITILVADVLALTAAEVGRVDSVYDRAALVALPADLRPRYVDWLRGFGRPTLAVTLDYDQARMDGPPFSVPEAELRRLYQGYTIEALGDERDDSRVTPMVERAWAIAP